MTRVLACDVYLPIGDETVHLRRGTRESEIPRAVRDARAVRPTWPPCSTCGRPSLDAVEVETDEPLLGEHLWINEDELEPLSSGVTMSGGSRSVITGEWRPFDRSDDLNAMR